MSTYIPPKAFDDIRPYCDEEIPKAMERIIEDDSFPLFALFVYPDKSLEEVKQQIANYRTIKEFQLQTMKLAIKRVIDNSISVFSYAGVERVHKDLSYLFVSNHRDIVLDSCLLLYSLDENGFDTAEITFGANLMMNPMIIDIGKSNKMFKVERPGKSIKDFYKTSKHLSDYIRHVILEKHQSVWIAQRNGRTKDGNDATDQGVIKMFCMSKRDDKISALSELHIVPIAISYEWESCDILKTIEVYKSQFDKYLKKPGEDLNSIITGLMQKKGRVHIEVCEPINREELENLTSLTNNEYHKAVAKIIDSRINTAYHLYPNNYIAYDILHGSTKFVGMYDEEQKEEFVAHIHILDQYDMYDIKRLKEIYLGIYSNPVENKG